MCVASTQEKSVTEHYQGLVTLRAEGPDTKLEELTLKEL